MTRMMNMCSIRFRLVAKPQSNKTVCYLSFVNKHLKNSEAMSMKSKFFWEHFSQYYIIAHYNMLFWETNYLVWSQHLWNYIFFNLIFIINVQSYKNKEVHSTISFCKTRAIMCNISLVVSAVSAWTILPAKFTLLADTENNMGITWKLGAAN